MTDSAPDPIGERAAALIALVHGHLESDPAGPDGPWPLVGRGLLVHATSTLKSMVFRLRPEGAHNDSARLLRSLYDHVTTFAWLAADPVRRLPLWRKEDLEERLKIDREIVAAGEVMLPDDARAQMGRDLATIEGNAPDLASKAIAADRFWVARVDAMRGDGLRSLRGFYTVFFRQHSGLVHATMRGLNHVTVELDPSRVRVVMEDPLSDGRGPYGPATVVYGIGLLIAAQSLGWPDTDQIEAVFDRFRDEDIS